MKVSKEILFLKRECEELTQELGRKLNILHGQLSVWANDLDDDDNSTEEDREEADLIAEHAEDAVSTCELVDNALVEVDIEAK